MQSLAFAHSISRSILRVTTSTVSAALLISCGGGGGNSGGSPLGGGIGLPTSASLAQQCAAPRPTDTQGTLATEKAFLRSWIDETYLWYQDVRVLPAATLDPTPYATPIDYFAALKTPLTTASGKPKDHFHFTYDTPTWIALSQSGIAYGYGFQVALIAAKPPRSAVVAFTEPGTPATMNSILRGYSVVLVDGVDLANGTDVATLNAGLFPTAAGNHAFRFRKPDNTTVDVTMNAQAITETPVQNVGALSAPNASVGYMLFNDHIATAESQLVTAINQLKAANVTDLVLDLRYNGGGYLDIASELAYMIGGSHTAGAFFERVNYNDRDPFNQTLAQRTTDFHSTGQGFSTPSGTVLPTLNLSRVFVLTTADTCSASEAIMNGLRGAGVTVNQIGGTTCGKPYGFFPKDNCNTTYFAIQFQGVNNLNFGDYADGFVPSPACVVADDFTRALGDPLENQLEVALSLLNTGTCQPPTSVRTSALSASRARAGGSSGPVLVRSPLRENRIYRPQ